MTDGGPWRGISLEAWIRRISPWPTPWIAPAGTVVRIPDPTAGDFTLEHDAMGQTIITPALAEKIDREFG